MKQRNLLLALVLLVLFAATGALYFKRFAAQKPFGIVLFVGEGLVTSKLAAARLYDGGRTGVWPSTRCPPLRCSARTPPTSPCPTPPPLPARFPAG